MPKRNHRKLPSRLGICKHCNKDTYPDRIGANLALEFLAKNPPRGADGPVRVYPCPAPKNHDHYHLTSKPEFRDIGESA